MIRVTEDQIKMLVSALKDSEGAKNLNTSGLVSPGESEDFYRGMVSGLVTSHQLLRKFMADSQGHSHLLSLAAARASQHYLDLKEESDNLFPELIDVD
ncbi:MAG: hypothetical protein WKF84_13400 [Pyrinomonadaceae bacterium]